MLLLLIAILNWVFVKNAYIKIGICILTVIAVEIMRKKGNKSKSIIFAEGISILLLIAYFIIFIVKLI